VRLRWRETGWARGRGIGVIVLIHSDRSAAAAAEAYLVEARGLELRFGSVQAVRDVSLRVAAGEILVLLGPNGAGKTTTLQMLAGLLPPSAGSAFVAGYDVRAGGEALRARVGLMVDEPGFYPEMTIDEYLLFVARLYRLPARVSRARIDALLDRFMLAPKRRARLSSLSKGMRQKVALIRAVLHEPPVLLLDEPTSALDPLSARAAHEYMRERRRAGDGILLCTHNLHEAESLADRVTIVAGGRVLREGTPDELRRAPDGREAYRLTVAGTPAAEVAALVATIPGLDLAVAAPRTRGHAADAAGVGQALDLTYHTACPDETNARLTATLARDGVAVLALAPCPESLGSAYLRAIEAA